MEKLENSLMELILETIVPYCTDVIKTVEEHVKATLNIDDFDTAEVSAT